MVRHDVGWVLRLVRRWSWSWNLGQVFCAAGLVVAVLMLEVVEVAGGIDSSREQTAAVVAVVVVLLRGTLVNRTYGVHKNLYI